MNYDKYVRGIQVLEQEQKSLDKCNPYFNNAVIFDIGSAEGLWSIIALAFGAKKVIAFDPKPVNEILSTIIVKNNVGLSPNLEVDEFVKDSGYIPDFMKIDVEGMELDVLNGAKETIKRYKPSIMIESHDYLHRGRKDEIIKILGEPTYIDIYHKGRLDPDLAQIPYICHIFYARAPTT